MVNNNMPELNFYITILTSISDDVIWRQFNVRFSVKTRDWPRVKLLILYPCKAKYLAFILQETTELMSTRQQAPCHLKVNWSRKPFSNSITEFYLYSKQNELKRRVQVVWQSIKYDIFNQLLAHISDLIGLCY